MRVILTAASRTDLSEIALFISRDNPARALTFVAELHSACQGLAEKPERFGLFPGLEKRGLRRRPLGNYIILYSVHADHVMVHRIANAALDFTRLFKPEPEA